MKPIIWILYNEDKSECKGLVNRLHSHLITADMWLQKDLFFDIKIATARGRDFPDPAQPPLCVFVIGGDGTIIGVARRMRDHQSPIVGINIGKLGYLAEFTIDEAIDNLKQILEGQMRRLELYLKPSGRLILKTSLGIMAINDVVIRDPYRVIDLSVQVDGKKATRIRGDGVIISTPTGSSGYTISAGGPLVDPHIDAIIITPLAPIGVTHRPFLVPGDTPISVRVESDNNKDAVTIIDGQEVYPVRNPLLVEKAVSKFQLIENPKKCSWDIAREKLRWGSE